jgi:ribosomal protein L40E
MKKPRKEPSKQNPWETKRIRKLALYGLIIGIILIISGILSTLPLIIIIGYTFLVICTGIYSFLTVLNWLSTKSLEREQKIKKEQKPNHLVCPRCGAKVNKNIEYCRKCGKKLTRKR